MIITLVNTIHYNNIEVGHNISNDNGKTWHTITKLENPPEYSAHIAKGKHFYPSDELLIAYEIDTHSDEERSEFMTEFVSDINKLFSHYCIEQLKVVKNITDS